MDIVNFVKRIFREGDVVTRLITVNVLFFVIFNVIHLICTLFTIDYINVHLFLSAPASFFSLLSKPWTVITYMFFHEGILHILFNMLTLYWFGKIFLYYFSPKQMVGLYVIGGLFGYVFFAGAYNIFPYFSNQIEQSVLLGASASVMAIIVAAAVKSPDLELHMLLIGRIKLKYIALIAVLMSFFGITSMNAGGEIAHLGGAFAGYFFVVSLRKGSDITSWINAIISRIYDVFKPRKLKVKQPIYTTNRKMSDAEYNQSKAKKMQEIDRILDKIKTSGYDSLSSEEKRQLFEKQ